MHPDSDLLKFDIVCCESALGNLFCFCEEIDKDFCFDIDRVEDTVFLYAQQELPYNSDP
jgi:hypothetical protein